MIPTSMTLNGVIACILRFSTEFDCFAGQLRHSPWRQTYNVRYSLQILAITNPPCSAVSLRQLSYLFQIIARWCNKKLNQVWWVGLFCVHIFIGLSTQWPSNLSYPHSWSWSWITFNVYQTLFVFDMHCLLVVTVLWSLYSINIEVPSNTNQATVANE